MNDFIKQHWHWHLLVGALIGWVLTKTFSGVPIPIQIFLVIFISGAIGTLWEWIFGALGKAKVDYRDVLFGVIGALLYYFIHLV